VSIFACKLFFGAGQRDGDWALVATLGSQFFFHGSNAWQLILSAAEG